MPEDTIHFKKQSGYVRRESWDDAVKAFDIMVEGLEQQKIKVA